MCGDGKLSERMFSLFKYIGFAPIGELLVMIVALTPLSRVSPLYNSCTKNRWTFFEALSQWGCLKRLTDVIVRPELFCKVTNEVDAEEHSSAAAQVFQELVEKLSLEDIGEVLLQPLGFSSDLLDTLVNASTSSTVDTSRRRTAVQILCFLLRRAAEPEVMCMVAGGPGNVATPSIVANRLHPLRERIISHLETRIGEVFNIILSFDSPSVPNSVSDVKGPIKYSAYKVDQPFTSMRSLLIEYMTLMAESDEMIATMMPLKLWRTLTKWILQYPANSIYQSYFYRLVFAVIRQNQEDALRTLFQRGRLISYLAETYVPLPSPSAPMPKKTAVDMINKMACRGLIVNCASAIRLQAQCLPPNSFLRQFLSAHPRWNSFINTIVVSKHIYMFMSFISISIFIICSEHFNMFSIFTIYWYNIYYCL